MERMRNMQISRNNRHGVPRSVGQVKKKREENHRVTNNDLRNIMIRLYN